MAQNLKLHKVVSLPGTLEANAIYLRKGGGDTYADLIITDTAGNGVESVSDARINALINAANNPEIQLVADITARNALSLTTNSLVLVTDASADTTVTSGAAMYFWDNTGASYVKVTEFESLDVVQDWNQLINKPTSTVAQIDQAVTDSHTHANKTQLDLIGQDGNGCFTYNGSTVNTWETVGW